jgi:hypothetical protein
MVKRSPLSNTCENIKHDRCYDIKCNCSCHNKSQAQSIMDVFDKIWAEEIMKVK